MATWKQFIAALTEAALTEGIGAEDVKESADGKSVVVTTDIEPPEGSTKKRRQTVTFEYDGKNTSWVAATSFIASAKDLNVPAVLEQLGKTWQGIGAVIVSGQLALRNHFSLDVFEEDGTEDTDEKLLTVAFASAGIISTLADFLEEHYAKDDTR